MRSVKSIIDSCELRTDWIYNVGATYGGEFMKKQWKRFWTDECGALLVSDWVFLATILVIAVIPFMHGSNQKVSDRGFEEIQAKKPAAVTVSNDR